MSFETVRHHGEQNFNAIPEYLQEAECAAKFGVSASFLRKLRYAGKLPAANMGGRLILYPVAQVREYFEKSTTMGAKGKCGAIHGKWAAKRAAINKLNPTTKVRK